jgi:cytochrome bd-type quinol oxidase subunit 2
VKRTLYELLHIVAGVVGTALIASVAAWGVPVATRAIWDVAYVAMAIVLFMGIRPLRLAWRVDREEKNGRPRTDG